MKLKDIDNLPFFYHAGSCDGTDTTYLVDQQFELLYETNTVLGIVIANGVGTVLCTNGSRYVFTLDTEIEFFVVRRVNVGFI